MEDLTSIGHGVPRKDTGVLSLRGPSKYEVSPSGVPAARPCTVKWVRLPMHEGYAAMSQRAGLQARCGFEARAEA